MKNLQTISGNEAAAEALRQINPNVFGAFPITPTTKIAEKFSEFVAQKKVETELILTESEHASLSVCVGAAAAGARAVTATASQGLSLMNEVLFNAAGMRLPLVLINGNRALGAPLSIHPDHSDIFSIRDSGFLIFFARDAQEIYDLILQSFPIAEICRTPVCVAMDGFETTHTLQNLQIESDEKVREFVGETLPRENLLNLKNPTSFGATAGPDYFMEFKRAQLSGILSGEKAAAKIGKKFNKFFGRDFSEPFEKFKTNDAEFVFVSAGSNFGAIKIAVENLRAKNFKVGAIRIRNFRPFPVKKIREILAGKKVAVVDRAFSGGAAGGPLFLEICGAIANLKNSPQIFSAVAGLGGRDFSPENAIDIFENFSAQNPRENFWANLRE